MAAVASLVVHEVLGHRAVDVDKPIIDYIINVLADEDFDFGVDGDGVLEAVGDHLVDSGCVEDYEEARLAFDNKFRYNAKHTFLVQSRIKGIGAYGHVDEIINDPHSTTFNSPPLMSIMLRPS